MPARGACDFARLSDSHPARGGRSARAGAGRVRHSARDPGAARGHGAALSVNGLALVALASGAALAVPPFTPGAETLTAA